MRVEATADPVAYRDAVFGWLKSDPVANSLLLSIVAGRIAVPGADARPATYVSVLDDDGGLVGVALRTPPWPILLGDLPPAAIGPVAETMAAGNADAPGVQGGGSQAQAFAERWRELTGHGGEVAQRLRLHRLGTLTALDAPGMARRATNEDLPLAVDWFEAFGMAVGEPMRRPHADLSATERVAAGRAWLWEHGGAPVCLVAHTEPQFGVSRIGPVYTPAERRRRGYAGALTAHVSRVIRDSGSDVCLYTDLGNATANKLYAEIGYEVVRDVVKYRFC